MENQKEYFIKLEDGTQVPVTAEIYEEYYRPEWREKKQEERDRKRLLSLDFEYEEGTTMKDFIVATSPSPEAIAEEKATMKVLAEALDTLSDTDGQVIKALFFEEMTERDYADVKGIPRTTINYRRNKALQRLKEYMSKYL